ncbi:methyl-accepting chemotaxis protein [Rhodohalobacter sp. SW132]|uniref:HAMP domain-containing methyl-accepting chemotaxis protein n=1 Tax=Rhodohalobacter sp. SW132 TaxID=2293433 RepID=UPI000E28A5E2|nr:methyl-accepting chemotaxis protein [Rhodohalobacter sp. SW132]REL38697.1 methyl-accepting chemotaxis protein [Rhodohalobacter sp. SW132]
MDFLKEFFNSEAQSSGAANSKWTIGKRIMLLGLGGAAITLVIGLIAVVSLFMIDRNADALVEVHLPELNIATSLDTEIREIGIHILNYSQTFDTQHWDVASERFSNVDTEIARAQQLLENHHLPELERRINDIETSSNEYRTSATEFYDASRELVNYRNQSDESSVDFQESMQEYLASTNVNSGQVMDLANGVAGAMSALWRAEALNDVQALQGIQAIYNQYRDDLGDLYDGTTNPELQMYLGIALASLNDNVNNVRQMIAARNRVNEQEAIRARAYEEILGHTSTLAQIARDESIAQGEQTQTAVTSFIFILSIGVLIAVAGAIIFGLTMSRSINSVMNDIIDRLSAGAEQVNASSNQLSGSSQELAESASEQAASLQQTTSSLEEIASQTKQTAENASEADRAMKETSPRVASGVEAMERMNRAMQEIKESSLETSKIIKTIDDIAFQTNLLALNAAVEAARAGEAGKGFAVVAEEVRNLAQRSAEAAQNTSDLIESSQATSDRGTNVAAEVSENLKKIEESVTSVGTLVDEIAAAANEQRTGITEMSTVMHEMDKTVQGNASNSEETASSAEELSSQAMELTNVVASLKALVGGSNGNRNNRSILKKPSVKNIPFKMSPQNGGNNSAKRRFGNGNGSGKINDRNGNGPHRSGPENGNGKPGKKPTEAHQLIPLDDDDFSGF